MNIHNGLVLAQWGWDYRFDNLEDLASQLYDEMHGNVTDIRIEQECVATNKLYLLHDEDYGYKVVVSAQNANEALEKLNTFLQETKQTGELWRDVKWIVDLCDNDKVIE